jgi:hypothetical protein
MQAAKLNLWCGGTDHGVGWYSKSILTTKAQRTQR